jgi:hypothetical protein
LCCISCVISQSAARVAFGCNVFWLVLLATRVMRLSLLVPIVRCMELKVLWQYSERRETKQRSDNIPYPSERKELVTVCGAAPLHHARRLPWIVLIIQAKEPAEVVAPPSKQATIALVWQMPHSSYGSYFKPIRRRREYSQGGRVAT